MKNCCKCNELIGEDQKICPFCNHEFTEEEQREERRMRYDRQQRAEKEAIAEFARTQKKASLIILITSVVAIAIVVAFILWSDMDPVGYYLLSFLIVGIMLVVERASGYGTCPYCGDFMGKATRWADYCPKCGGRIR